MVIIVPFLSFATNKNFIDYEKNDKKSLEERVYKFNNNYSKKNKQSFFNELTKENITILNDVNKLNNDFVKTKTNAKVYSPNITGYINVKMNAYNNRIIILNKLQNNEILKDFKYDSQYFYDNEKGKTNYKITKVNKINSKLIQQKVISILENENIPKNLTYNLKIFISPYSFDKVKGYSMIYNLKENENYIVISSDIKYLEENLYHELGHIYWQNIIKNNKNFKDKYVSLYKKCTFNSNIWEYNLEENFAEDFKVYMFKKKNIYKNKKTNIPYNNKVEKLIDKNSKYLKKEDNLFFPNITIKTNSKDIILSSKNKTLDTLFLPRKNIMFNIYNNPNYKNYIEVCNDNNCYKEKNSHIFLKPNTNYLIKLYYLSNNYKFEVGKIKIFFI